MKLRFIGFTLMATVLAVGAVHATSNRTPTPSTITLSQPTGAAATADWPHLGDWVNFTVTYPKSVNKYGVRIQVICYQNGNLVYGEAGPYTQSFLLGGASSEWQQLGGPADCVADLYYWSYNGGQKFNWLASADFVAADRVF